MYGLSDELIAAQERKVKNPADILIVHATIHQSESSADAMYASHIQHNIWGEALLGARFDIVVVANRPPTEGSIAALAMQVEFVNRLECCLRPGGHLIFAEGADPRGQG